MTSRCWKTTSNLIQPHPQVTSIFLVFNSSSTPSIFTHCQRAAHPILASNYFLKKRDHIILSNECFVHRFDTSPSVATLVSYWYRIPSCDPWPIALTHLAGHRVRVWDTCVPTISGTNGKFASNAEEIEIMNVLKSLQFIMHHCVHRSLLDSFVHSFLWTISFHRIENDKWCQIWIHIYNIPLFVLEVHWQHYYITHAYHLFYKLTASCRH